MSDSVVKPDPAHGIEAAVGYADHYALSHQLPPNLDYKRGYVWLLIIDALLQDYVLLDVGCGTAGYYRLARNYRKIVGLDSSQAMIDNGRVLQSQLGLKNTELRYGSFASYEPDQQFDAVNLVGVFGHYVPWTGNEAALRKARTLLRGGGIVSLAYVRPRTLFQLLKAILFPRRTIVIRQAPFMKMLKGAGLEMIFSVDDATKTYVFCRRTD